MTTLFRVSVLPSIILNFSWLTFTISVDVYKNAVVDLITNWFVDPCTGTVQKCISIGIVFGEEYFNTFSHSLYLLCNVQSYFFKFYRVSNNVIILLNHQWLNKFFSWRKGRRPSIKSFSEYVSRESRVIYSDRFSVTLMSLILLYNCSNCILDET